MLGAFYLACIEWAIRSWFEDERAGRYVDRPAKDSLVVRWEQLVGRPMLVGDYWRITGQ